MSDTGCDCSGGGDCNNFGGGSCDYSCGDLHAGVETKVHGCGENVEGWMLGTGSFDYDHHYDQQSSTDKTQIALTLTKSDTCSNDIPTESKSMSRGNIYTFSLSCMHTMFSMRCMYKTV